MSARGIMHYIPPNWRELPERDPDLALPRGLVTAEPYRDLEQNPDRYLSGNTQQSDWRTYLDERPDLSPDVWRTRTLGSLSIPEEPPRPIPRSRLPRYIFIAALLAVTAAVVAVVVSQTSKGAVDMAGGGAGTAQVNAVETVSQPNNSVSSTASISVGSLTTGFIATTNAVSAAGSPSVLEGSTTMRLTVSTSPVLPIPGATNQTYTAVPGGRTGSANTTTYWDCCKPSCGWLSNSGLTGVAARSCAASGATLTAKNVKNPCGGGGITGPEDGFAYACTDAVPIVVNSDLAYGFAALPFPDVEECCACYELTFTSSAIAGKRMVVQKINNGRDLATTQFDLQIPGGGLGIFDGCSRQFGVDANTNWGFRYGGVTNVTGCGVLPSALQEGCAFRFGWFMGANSPSATYRRVTCPDALVAKSGCNR
ncbi:hypothetical protein HDU93_004835 [Gonapodya sp. JEL0774]|nr:hypothetical protein HDU93_004835 [Gonapodya sp. JEL0774]